VALKRSVEIEFLERMAAIHHVRRRQLLELFQ